MVQTKHFVFVFVDLLLFVYSMIITIIIINKNIVIDSYSHSHSYLKNIRQLKIINVEDIYYVKINNYLYYDYIYAEIIYFDDQC
jgi:hypothetical protein